MHYRKQQKYVKYVGLTILWLLFFVIIQSDADNTVAATDITEKSAQTTLSHDEIIALTDQFMETLLQQTRDDNKVLHYHHKADLLDAFAPIATKEVATTYVDYYYNSKADGLYMVPTERPPWFDKEIDYDKVNLNDGKVQVVQKNKSAMYGSYQVVYEFTVDDEHNWKITKITHA